MYQFFVQEDQIQDELVMITGSDVNHIKNVLRMKVGDEIAVSNGVDGREYRCEISELQEDSIICGLRFINEDELELSSKVYLFQGLPKSDKMEMIIQKAVELGVFQIIPVASKRTVVKLDDKKEKSKLARWQVIAESAAKQSKRSIVPEVKRVMSFREAVQYAADMDMKLIPYELAEGMEITKSIIDGLQRDQTIAVFIGPEGGFDTHEIQMAADAGLRPVTLGKRILRTETAGIVVLSWIMYQLEI